MIGVKASLQWKTGQQGYLMSLEKRQGEEKVAEDTEMSHTFMILPLYPPLC